MTENSNWCIWENGYVQDGRFMIIQQQQIE